VNGCNQEIKQTIS